MYDIFLTEDVRKLMKNKSIVFLGDSNVRALYKDFLCLLQESKFITNSALRNKMEMSLYGDKLVYHGRKTNGRCYREERRAVVDETRASFYFLTRVYDDYVEEILEKITWKSKPDVIIINSCVWDITRWGCDGVKHYKSNLKLLMEELKALLPDCLVIWVTTPPLAAEMKGGFLVKELQFLKYSLRFHVVEANHFARKVVVENGFDVLDTHFHLQMQIHRRSGDGVHWNSEAVRYITNLILRHISLSWDVPLPHRYESAVSDVNLVTSEDTDDHRIIELVKKEKDADVKQIHSTELVDLKPNWKLQSMVTVVENPDGSKKKRRSSIQLYRVPQKEERIHNHMSRVEKMARLKKIRKWKPYVQGDSSQSHASYSSRKSRSRKKNRRDRRPLHEVHHSSDSYQYNQRSYGLVTPSSHLPHTQTDNSRKAPSIDGHCHILLSQIPLPPNSPGYQQPYNSYVQSAESTIEKSNDLKFSLNNSPSQIPLPPHNRGHYQPTSSQIQRNESQKLLSAHFDFPVIANSNEIPCPPYNPYHSHLDNDFQQQPVVGYQTADWSSPGFMSNGNGANSCSQSVILNQRSFQRNEMFETVGSCAVPYKLPHVIPRQSFQPRNDFF